MVFEGFRTDLVDEMDGSALEIREVPLLGDDISDAKFLHNLLFCF